MPGLNGIDLASGTKVLLLWAGSQMSANMQNVASTILEKVKGGEGRIQLEHIDRLLLSAHPNSHFDVVVSGLVNPLETKHTTEILGELCRVLKSSGTLYMQELALTSTEPQSNVRTKDQLVSQLKLSGFIDICEPSEVSLNDEEKTELKQRPEFSEAVALYRVTGKKPAYEVGSSSQLRLPFKPKAPVSTKVDSNVAKVWSLNSTDLMDDDVDLVDEDELLDENDLKKPDPASLKVECGPTKKKACKDCTCGLAEELESGKKSEAPAPVKTSACGNCYLGDAFRCGSCPYLGMPAFKAGEKITLSSRQLNADA
ncbi:anamorsin homolog [Elysia marginata]|uniref:Anamorsin homolog n=1 Tax=Elysia marginata TaxID=1093978 RepID=A0AAV4IQ70_9GAST|nr:anamorsin homolog [Elysia marginata]